MPFKEDSLTIEEGQQKGATAPLFAVCIKLGRTPTAPPSIHGGNVRGMTRLGDAFLADMVVVADELHPGDNLILVESTAPLIGYYNPEPDVICGAYGRPVVRAAWNVTVGHVVSQTIASGPAVHYEGILLHITTEIELPKETA